MLITPKTQVFVYEDCGVLFTKNSPDSFRNYVNTLTSSSCLKYVEREDVFGQSFFRFDILEMQRHIYLTKDELKLFKDEEVFMLYLKIGIPI